MSEAHPQAEAKGSGLHPRNAHRQGYDFPALVQAEPGLADCLVKTPTGQDSIDFANPAAVKLLNRALLKAFYGIRDWDIPAGYLCPPVPGRADYLHYVADLLAESHGGIPPVGRAVRVLDIGVGANCIYPIIGNHAYKWRFVGTDIDAKAVQIATAIVKFNPSLAKSVEIRLQPSSSFIFGWVWKPKERFDLTICNPPFHASQEEADAATTLKLQKLGLEVHADALRNFGGMPDELFTPGGEFAFLKQMVGESRNFSKSCLWFSALVSKSANLKPLQATAKLAGAKDVRVMEMQQGQKKSRVLAWTFLNEGQREAWAKEHWG